MTPAPVAGTGSVVADTLPAPSPVDKGLRWVTSILILIFPTATLFVNRGDSYVLGLLTLIGIWVWLRDGARRWLDRPSAVLWIAFALFFAVALLSYLLGTQTDAGFRFLGRYLRFLLIVPVYLALRRYPPTAKTVIIGLALGALLAGVIGGLHVYHLDAVIRIEATTGQPIIFGDLATTMTLCAVAGFGLLAASRRRWVVPLLVLCVIGGTAATLLSGTRGAWIPLLLLPSLLVTQIGGFVKGRYALAIILVLAAVFAAFYFVPGSGTQVRITDAGGSLRNYFVALPYIDTPRKGTFGDPICRDEFNLLRAWVSADSTVSGTMNLAIVPDRSLGHAAGCRTDYVVRLHNPSSTQYGQRIFRRVPNRKTLWQHTSMLMRGAGAIAFIGGDPKSVTVIDSPEYRHYSLTDHKTAGNFIDVIIAPGGTVWLVPLDNYFGEYSSASADNSVGHRLELWRAGWLIFLRHPVLGVGFGAFQENLDELIRQGRIAGFVHDYDHPHNDYLNALASAGIIGFFALLAILVVPMVHFWRALRSKDAVSHTVGLAGALTVLGFAIYALTDTIFLHSMMITWYVVYMALFYALLSTRASRTAIAEPPEQ